MIPNFIVKKLFINLSKFLFLSIIFLFIFNQVKSDEKYDKGKIIFLKQGNCAACHTLLDAGSDGNIGPNLNEVRPDIMRVIAAVTNGIGVMPAYQGELSPEEIEAVAHYVSVSSE
jgi:mono/diheme cytochrome c family protein|tara:strand:+ start:226 stop:570 length:345 start_codon:yes stop_codon:yes gene_type:complete